MYRKDLDNYLKQRLPKAVFLYGEFDFLSIITLKRLARFLNAITLTQKFRFFMRAIMKKARLRPF